MQFLNGSLDPTSSESVESLVVSRVFNAQLYRVCDLPVKCECSYSQAAKVTGVTKVLHADDPAYGRWVAENVSRAVAAVQVGADELETMGIFI